MTDFKAGDKVRMIGDPDDIIGTVTAVGKCNDVNYDGQGACGEPMVTFEDEHGKHSTHAEDLEPAD